MASIGFECEVSELAIRDFKKALARYQRETQRDSRSALRSATVDLIKSLRAQTKQAKKLVPKKAFRFGQSDPQYLTINGQLHRRMVKKNFPSSDRLRQQKDLVFFQPVRQVYKRRKLKNGGIAESWTEQSGAQLIREAREKWGKIWNWGLARKTWGWMMWRLFNLPDNGKFMNPRCNVTHKHCEAHIDETRERLPDGTITVEAPIKCDITLINRLRYIRKALPQGALAVAIEKARKSITAKIDKGLKSRRFDS